MGTNWKLLAGAVAISAVLWGCSTPEKLMCKTWKVNRVEFDSTSAFDRQLQQAFAKEIVQIKFGFRADSSYYVKTLTDSVTGKWWLNKTTMVFTTDNDRMGRADSKIIKLDKKTLVYSTKDAAGSEMRFNCIPLTKK